MKCTTAFDKDFHYHAAAPRPTFFFGQSTMFAEDFPSRMFDSELSEESESIEAIRRRALGDSRKRYALLFEKNLAGMYLTTLDGRILDANRAFARMLGYGTSEEVYAVSAWKLYPAPSDRELFLQELKGRGSLMARETTMRRQDGSTLRVLEDVRLLAGEFICGMMIDITDRKKAEDAANQSRELLQLLIESTDDVILMQNLDGVFIYANPSSTYGIPPEQVVGKNPYDLFDRETAENMMSRVQTILRTRKPLIVQDPVVWRGETLWFHSHIYPVCGDHGEVVAVSTFGRNITEQQRAMVELRSVEERLRMERLRMQIAADLHDDIGSILSSISIFAAMAIQGLETPGRRPAELMQKVEDNARAAMHTLDEIVWSIKPENDLLGNIIQRLEEYPRELLGLRDIEYHSTIEGTVEEQHLPLEKRRNFYLIFREALNNLLRHAEATRTEMTLRVGKERIQLVLHDNGKGFDATAEAAGNGLRNMRRRAEALGGTLQIHSAPGRGTTLELSFPIT
jgi:PAS domain S-box-containing protein